MMNKFLRKEVKKEEKKEKEELVVLREIRDALVVPSRTSKK